MSLLKPGKTVRPPVKQYLKDSIALGIPRVLAKRMYNNLGTQETWLNEKYVVLVYRDSQIPPDMNPNQMKDLVWLSIRRQDRGHLIDWRDLQAIKNQLLGTEAEAVQLFPSQHRVVDTSNQFHLFGFSSKEKQFPFGFPVGAVTDKEFINTKQRAL